MSPETPLRVSGLFAMVETLWKPSGFFPENKELRRLYFMDPVR